MNSLLNLLAERSAMKARDELLDCAERLRDRGSKPEAWTLKLSPPWAYFDNRDVSLPRQGWKLHVAATHGSALQVLEALLPALFEEECAFKFAATRPLIREINQAHSPRGSSGKFLTIYPRDEAAALRLAELCDQHTHGLLGPRILSDRAYREGGIVHYRYGAFSLDEVFTADATLVKVLRDPAGRPVPDLRNAWFAHPSWIEDPFVKAGRVAPAPDPTSVKSVVLNGRYRIEAAVRHANKGGVYRARDERTGEEVILKEARPHVAADREHRDARDYLRAEADNLRRLDGMGLTPRVREIFSKEDHLFLVLDLIAGQTLRRHIYQRRNELRRMLPVQEVEALTRGITAVLAACHRAGLLIMDFTPNNLMVQPDGALSLIDLELACAIGDRQPVDAGTPGYISPQQLRRAAPETTDDYFSLGAVIFFIATLYDPFLIADQPEGRSDISRLGAWLDYLIGAGLVQPHIAEAALGCLAVEPGARWTPERVLDHLGRQAAAPVAPAAASVASIPAPEDVRAAVRGAATYALDNLDTADPKRPFASLCQNSRTDPCCIQHGAAGVGWFLSLLLPTLDDGGAAAKLRQLAAWTLACIRRQPERPPGLYFGSAGAAWFLLTAALALDDAELHEAACRLARSLALEAEASDVTHGAAGIGMTLLHFFGATKQPEFLDRAAAAADLIAAAARSHGGGLAWPRRGRGDELQTFFGFAHGNAGIAYYLLAAHAVTGESRFLAAAEGGLATLLANVEMEDDLAFWWFGPDRPSRWPYWCNGSSGVGTTLLRAYRVTGDARYRRLAEAAARTVIADRFLGSLGQCHGLAGNGEFLLDMSHFLGEERYRAMAWQLAESMFLRRVVRQGRTLFPDDSGASLAVDFGTGTSGVGAFLHRLVAGGMRPFMVDEVLLVTSATPGAPAGSPAALVKFPP